MLITIWDDVIAVHPRQALAKPRRKGGEGGGGGGSKLQSLAALGYAQASLDDAWQACDTGVNRSFHDIDGNPLIDLKLFPNMSAMTSLGRSKSSLATENLLENTNGVPHPPPPSGRGRVGGGGSEHPIIGTLLPSIYADARYIGAVIVSQAMRWASKAVGTYTSL